MGTGLSLVALALLDSTSIGTLVVPLLLVVRSRGVQVRPLAIYLGTVVGLYFLVGVALLLGAEAIASRVSGLLDERPVLWMQLGLGVALLAYGVFADRIPGMGDGDRMCRRSFRRGQWSCWAVARCWWNWRRWCPTWQRSASLPRWMRSWR